MIIELSVALIAIAFAILVIFLIKTLQAAKGSLEKVSQTLQEVQKTVDELSYEVKQTVRHANDITVDVQAKMKQIDPVMDTVKNIGEVLSEVSLAAKQVSSSLMDRFKNKSEISPASQRLSAVPSTTAEERTIQSYEGTYKGSAGSGWMKWVDTAAVLWQKYRH